MDIEQALIRDGEEIVAEFEATFQSLADAFESSIKFGSSITGAPGQPVVTGTERDSWTQKRIDANTIEISTVHPAAKKIEYGHQKTTNHGPFSMTKTIAGFGKLVNQTFAKGFKVSVTKLPDT
jgi:hypothetical protein